MKYLLFFTLVVICTFEATDIILSAGIGKWSRQQMHSQYTTFKAYKEIGLITTASILTYELSDEGTLESYQGEDGNAESFQYAIKKDLGLKALPCLFCDATIGACSNIASRLEKLYANESSFIADSLIRAKKYNWDGYSVDFEPDGFVNSTKLTNFMLNWAKILKNNGLTLSIWIGGPTQYDTAILLNNTNLINLITMSTYDKKYQDFITLAASLQTSSSNIFGVGFGLLTYSTNLNTISDDDIVAICHWMKISKVITISIWAASIPPSWNDALLHFLN